MSVAVNGYRRASRRVQVGFGLAAFAGLATLAACGSGGSTTSSGAASCTPAHTGFKTLKSGVLAVASEEALPYGGVKNGQVTGTDGDIVTAIANMECLTISPDPVSGSAVIPSVQSGKVDIGMGDWYRNAKRLAVIQMSDALYVDQNAFVSKTGVDTFAALTGLQVGAAAGSNFDPGLAQLLGGSFHQYSTEAAPYQDLRAGRLDVVVDSAGVAKTQVTTDFQIKVPTGPVPAAMGTSFDPSGAGLPINSQDTGLQTAINADLATLKQNGKLLTIITKWGLPASALDTAGK